MGLGAPALSGMNEESNMDAVRIKQFAGNLKHAAFTGKGATIGGGKFSAAECKAAAIALDAAPAMLAALETCLASAIARRDAAKVYDDKAGNPCKADVQAEIDAIHAAIAAATGER